jgi:hypothetical protein
MRFVRDFILSILMLPFIAVFVVLFFIGLIIHFPFWRAKRMIVKEWTRLSKGIEKSWNEMER